MRLKIPSKVEYILSILERHGFEAYAVGGCVRDSVLAREPNDWDITTSARPEQVKECFRRTVDTGIKHGTVTVMLQEDAFEVTTFRIDGEYSDGRHPDSVEFTPLLSEDLRRRDFTINAMAYNEREGLVDLFGGMQDLQRKMVRCVGDPDARFNEEALRVMRAVRFAAQLGFRIEPATRDSAGRHAPELRKISEERIRTELLKLIASPHPEMFGELHELGITDVILPEFNRMMETEQNTPHHMWNVGMHTIKAMCEIPADPVLRMTMLLHDVGKPDARWTDSRGRDHFKGHAEIGAKMADGILRRLKFDNLSRKRIVNLVRWHDLRPEPNEVEVRHAMYAVGPEAFEDYLAVQWADNMAKSEYKRAQKLDRINRVYEVYRMICDRGDCLSIRDLAIDGEDILALGARGREVGEMLEMCLHAVLDRPDLNEQNTLKMLVKKELHL